jgi:hypothetical protein
MTLIKKLIILMFSYRKEGHCFYVMGGKAALW